MFALQKLGVSVLALIHVALIHVAPKTEKFEGAVRRLDESRNCL